MRASEREVYKEERYIREREREGSKRRERRVSY